METKLTLRMDSHLIEKAKRWARARNISLSQAISIFFEAMTKGSAASRETEEISPWVRNLSIGKTSARRLTAKQIRKMHLSDLERKYR